MCTRPPLLPTETALSHAAPHVRIQNLHDIGTRLTSIGLPFRPPIGLCHFPMLGKFPRMVGVLLSLGCAPTQVSESGRSSAKPSPLAPSFSTEGQERTPVETKTPVVAHGPEVCGMPDRLREPDWPLELDSTHKGPPPRSAGSLAWAVLPDTQYYSSCRSPHLSAQANWLVRHLQSQNIGLALTLGDLTDHNSPEEWQFFRDGVRPLARALPLVLTLGNHDYGHDGSADRRMSLFGEFFRTEAQASGAALARTFEPNQPENGYYRFLISKNEAGNLTQVPLGQAQTKSGESFVLGVLSLEWSPRKSVVSWAKDVLREFNEDRRILTTHAYLYNDDTRYDLETRGQTQNWNPRTYGIERADGDEHGGHDGEMLWRELVEPDPGFFLTLSGHVLGDGTGHLISPNRAGRPVHQVLVNYQMLREGGLGYLRLFELTNDASQILVHTYSPSLDQHSLAPDQDFSLDLGSSLFRPLAGGPAAP
jgi:Calcineurin-like phosphoesterase